MYIYISKFLYTLFSVISGLSFKILSTMFSFSLNGTTYPSNVLAFSCNNEFSSLTYILDFPFPFFASCTKFETGEFPSKATTTELLLSNIS